MVVREGLSPKMNGRAFHLRHELEVNQSVVGTRKVEWEKLWIANPDLDFIRMFKSY